MTPNITLDSDYESMPPQRDIVTMRPKERTCYWRTWAKYAVVLFCLVNVILLIVGGVWPALTSYAVHNQKQMLVIQTDKLTHIVSETFLSVAIDSSTIAKKFAKYDLKGTPLKTLARPLAPCYLRVGGTAADSLIFQEKGGDNITISQELPRDGGSCAYEGEACEQINNFFMTGRDFETLGEFARDVGMNIIFDLNVLIRSDDSWDNRNAIILMQFAQDRKFQMGWELGNEPNAFEHVFHRKISASQLGSDFLNLKQTLSTFELYENALMVGPDVTRPRLPEQDDLEYLREFLRKVGTELNAVTWHQYYFNGRDAQLHDFTNIEVLNELYTQISMVKKAVSEMALHTPIWLGETGSAYGGGAPGLSDRYVASFMWLDKLGISATQGLDVVIRQTLFGGHYALFNEHLEPSPDYWISVLYKTIVGRGVVNITQIGNNNKGHVRIYCHCTRPAARIPGLGAITIFGFNLKSISVDLSLQGTHNISRVHRYIFEAGEGGLESKEIYLNGHKLGLMPNGELPGLYPELVDLSAPITLPPQAIGFWVLHGAQVPGCHGL